MEAIKISELFYSLQGEGKYVGVPSIFMRTFGCNFTCGGFGMPRGEKSEQRFHFPVENYPTYQSLPLVSTGCDSYASWDPRFKHLSPLLTIDAIIERMTSLLPNGDYNNKDQPIHLVITGGEPLLGWQKMYPALLEKLFQKQGLDFVTFETNGTQPLHDDMIQYMMKSTIKFTMSISPKLAASGEARSDAIKPEVIMEYIDALENKQNFETDDIYFKFVVDKPEDVEEIDSVLQQYALGGCFYIPVYLMPVGGTGELYYKNNQQVAKMALDRGWRYSPRIQVDLWKNAWGT